MLTLMKRSPDPRRFLAARFWRSASGFWRASDALESMPLTAVLIAGVLLQLALQVPD